MVFASFLVYLVFAEVRSQPFRGSCFHRTDASRLRTHTHTHPFLLQLWKLLRASQEQKAWEQAAQAEGVNADKTLRMQDTVQPRSYV